jgi:hypothetical protein
MIGFENGSVNLAFIKQFKIHILLHSFGEHDIGIVSEQNNIAGIFNITGT